MKTIQKTKSVKKDNKELKSLTAPGKVEFPAGFQKEIPIDEIDICEFNYRKLIVHNDIVEFSEELSRHGIISPVTVRPMPSGRFELVVGERRLRGAMFAKIKMIPSVIRELSDAQVTELQLAENIERVNPHPLHQAQGVLILLAAGYSIEQIALRMGKSKAFVYNHKKIAELTESFQQVFLSDKISMKDALEISGLAVHSQEELFEAHFTDWKEPDFNVYNLNYHISRYKYDLKKAPFDIKDKKLVLTAGACTNCPFNSATLKTLFPELAKEAICSNKSCFQSKCISQKTRNIIALITEQKPQAILTGYISEDYQMLIDSLPETVALPQHSYQDVTVINTPALPVQDHYIDDDDIEEGASVFDEESYNEALAEYNAVMAEHQQWRDTGKVLIGLYFNYDTVKVLPFTLEKKLEQTTIGKVTAKEVQEAIKAGTVTEELLQAEIQRIRDREDRLKVGDREKVQVQVHEQFSEMLKQPDPVCKITDADRVAIRLLVFQSLDYSAQQYFSKLLLSKTESEEMSSNDNFYTGLSQLGEDDFALMIRKVIRNKSESTYPTHITGYCLYKMAEASGVDVTAIEKQQQEKVNDREEKMNLKIKDVEKRIERLKTAA